MSVVCVKRRRLQGELVTRVIENEESVGREVRCVSDAGVAVSADPGRVGFRFGPQSGVDTNSCAAP
jgi:16S rRNA C1402 (ribose-2'-O) methylase RsmI